MKACSKSCWLLWLVLEGFCFAFAGRVSAQTFATLYTFTPSFANPQAWLTNIDGGAPVRLMMESNILYGLANEGGTEGGGTIFKVNLDGSNFMVIHTFSVPPDGNLQGTNSDGVFATGLTLSGDTLYGTTKLGGEFGCGTVFKVKIDETNFTTLHSFTNLLPYPPRPGLYTNVDGINPIGGVIVSGTNLFGTTMEGGSSANGTVFSLDINGTNWRTLHSFGPGPDGMLPVAPLSQSLDTLYGTTFQGGANYPDAGYGTVFSIGIDGSNYKTIYRFPTPTSTTADGGSPAGQVLVSGDMLYTTSEELDALGASGNVFRLDRNGTGFAQLYTFSPIQSSNQGYQATTNNDGALPYASLILCGDTLYGAASRGGPFGTGTVFSLKTNGTAFSVLHSFPAVSAVFPYTNIGGAFPGPDLVLSGSMLYGTTVEGGLGGNGTIFSISLPVKPPQLTITPSGQKIILTWPTNLSGFALQSTTNLASPIWATNLPAPVAVNGRYAISNPITGTQQFFRLSQ